MFPGSGAWGKYGAVCFRRRDSTARPDAEYYTSKPVRPHLRGFEIRSRRTVTVKIRARIRKAEERPLEVGHSVNMLTAFPLTLRLPRHLPQSERTETAR